MHYFPLLLFIPKQLRRLSTSGTKRRTCAGSARASLGSRCLILPYLNLSREKAPGWGINGPGVSAEWTQGGESEWNSAAASADETRAVLYQDLEIPRGGEYRLWVRYADWAKRSENFTITIAQDGAEVFRHEFGAKDVIDPHDELSMYWSWVFAWDSANDDVEKRPGASVDRDRKSRGSTTTRRLFVAHERSGVQTVRQAETGLRGDALPAHVVHDTQAVAIVAEN